MTAPTGRLAPAFYAPPTPGRRSARADWWLLLHAPYTLWHLSFVVIGGTIAPRFDAGHLAASVVAFFLAVGLGAHALDELRDRPLRTSISSRALVAVAVVSISSAVALGIAGTTRVGLGLVVFIVIGVVLNAGYNLELFDGRLHTDAVFALAWGSFPVLTSYYVQAGTLHAAAFMAAAFACTSAVAQRSLSTPARTLRRRVESLDGVVTFTDGTQRPISRRDLLAPLEGALKAMTWSVVALAFALVLHRTGWASPM